MLPSSTTQPKPTQASPAQASPGSPAQAWLRQAWLRQARPQTSKKWYGIWYTHAQKHKKIWDLLEIHHFHHNLAVPPGGCVFTLFKYEVDKFNLENRLVSDGTFFLKNRGFLLISRISAFFTIFLAKHKQKPMIFNDESMAPSKSSTYVSINPCMHRTAFVGRPREFDVFLFKARLTMEKPIANLICVWQCIHVAM